MPKYKLYYFNFRGRAEVIRLVFAAAGQPYEDVRLTKEEWQKEKPSKSLGSVYFVLMINIRIHVHIIFNLICKL